mmetsp:Transcript_60417/g.124254  ORF Transcript_60417/g.124254 Transcript_60417/m.124254 type:complete len:215 (+) Transcript_60417:1142-1786(+)
MRPRAYITAPSERVLQRRLSGSSPFSLPCSLPLPARTHLRTQPIKACQVDADIQDDFADSFTLRVFPGTVPSFGELTLARKPWHSLDKSTPTTGSRFVPRTSCSSSKFACKRVSLTSLPSHDHAGEGGGPSPGSFMLAPGCQCFIHSSGVWWVSCVPRASRIGQSLLEAKLISSREVKPNSSTSFFWGSISSLPEKKLISSPEGRNVRLPIFLC